MLTRHGRHLVEQGTRLLDGLEELQAGLHRQAGTVAGHVRLTAFSTAMRGLVAPAPAARPRGAPGPARQPHRARAVGHRQPGRLRAGRPRRRAQLGRPPAAGPRPPGPHRPGPRPRRVDRPPRPPAGRPRRSSPPRDLAGEDWVATPEGSICRQWLLRMYDGTGRLPRVAHVSVEFDSHLALVRAGLGIALVPRPRPRGTRPRPGGRPGRRPGAEPRDRRAAPRLDERLPGHRGAPAGPRQGGRRLRAARPGAGPGVRRHPSRGPGARVPAARAGPG